MTHSRTHAGDVKALQYDILLFDFISFWYQKGWRA